MSHIELYLQTVNSHYHQNTTSFWGFKAIMKVEHNFVDKMTDVIFSSTTDKQSPVMCKSFWRRLVTKYCSVSKFYHNLYRLTQPATVTSRR